MPQTIQRLPPEVVNRIAAGEVIQRPSAALKELVENSIDAGASRINIVLGQSGLKFLSITDNGCGIAVDDFTLLCERFTTSKLREYKDLDSIETFGFRGEALASISHVAHVLVTSKTADAKTAFKASFLDGKICDLPQPCAGLQGTQIVIEDLFYNIPMRLNALKNLNDEYNRCLMTLSYLAVHFHKVAFTVKKQGKTKCDLNTSGKSSRQDTIRLLFGQVIAKELLQISCIENSSQVKMQLDGLVTHSNFNAKTFTLALFINQRLVECNAIRRVVESVFAPFLPKGAYPFVYLDVRVPPDTVDVNVHPTKREVGLLYESEIVELLEMGLQSTLAANNQSRTYVVQNITQTLELPGVAEIAKKVVYPSQTVRTDFRAPAGRLAAYLSHPDMMTLSGPKKSDDIDSIDDDVPVCDLASVRELLDDIRIGCCESLSDVFKMYSFVGCVDDDFCLIQGGTKLYIVNVPVVTNCFFYERCLRNFSRLPKLRLQSSSRISICNLCRIALNDPNSGWTSADGDKQEIAIHISRVFINQRRMLSEYFSIDVSEQGDLLTLPQMLRQYVPPLALLPMFVLRCGSEVEWSSEKQCFRELARELARLYQVHPGMYLDGGLQDSRPSLQWIIEHVLLPALQTGFSPPKHLIDNVVRDNTFLCYVGKCRDCWPQEKEQWTAILQQKCLDADDEDM